MIINKCFCGVVGKWWGTRGTGWVSTAAAAGATGAGERQREAAGDGARQEDNVQGEPGDRRALHLRQASVIDTNLLISSRARIYIIVIYFFNDPRSPLRGRLCSFIYYFNSVT